MSAIGKEYFLHTNPFPRKKSRTPDRFVRIEVVETREVPGTWNAEEKYTGLKGLGSDGNIYYCNWDKYPDDSRSPMYMWHSEGEIWYDVTYIRQVPFAPSFLEENQDLLHWCEKHQNLGYKRTPYENEQGKEFWCFRCRYKEEGEDNPKQKWNGWR